MIQMMWFFPCKIVNSNGHMFIGYTTVLTLTIGVYVLHDISPIEIITPIRPNLVWTNLYFKLSLSSLGYTFSGRSIKTIIMLRRTHTSVLKTTRITCLLWHRKSFLDFEWSQLLCFKQRTGMTNTVYYPSHVNTMALDITWFVSYPDPPLWISLPILR